MVQPAAANQLFTAAFGALDRTVGRHWVAAVSAGHRSDPVSRPLSPVDLTVGKPYKDWLPQVKASLGELDRSPEAFLAQYYLYGLAPSWRGHNCLVNPNG